MTFTCKACRLRRQAEKISTLKRQWTFPGGGKATEHMNFCNDNPACRLAVSELPPKFLPNTIAQATGYEEWV